MLINLPPQSLKSYPTNLNGQCCRDSRLMGFQHKKVQVGKDQEKAQSERDSHSKIRGGKKKTN